MQYPGKDLYDDMSWQEFCTLLNGIMPETPLGQIVQIRSENDKDILKHFTPKQKEIRNEWRVKMSKQESETINEDEYMKMMKALQGAFLAMAK